MQNNHNSMKTALSIKNAPISFGIFLMQPDVEFRFSYGDFIIENTHDEQKFINYCLRNGVRKDDIDRMEFSVIEING